MRSSQAELMLTSNNTYSQNMMKLEQVNVNLSEGVIYILWFASAMFSVLIGLSCLVVI